VEVIPRQLGLISAERLKQEMVIPRSRRLRSDLHVLLESIHENDREDPKKGKGKQSDGTKVHFANDTLGITYQFVNDKLTKIFYEGDANSRKRASK